MGNPFKTDDENTEISTEAEVIVDENNTDNTENNETQEETEDVAETSDLDALQEKYDTLNNQYIRLAADFDNFRKRQAQERESLLKYGAEDTLKKLIEVIDNFERGSKAIADVDNCETVKESFNLVYKQFMDTLNKIGLETIEAKGKEFDPNFHEAVMQTPSEDEEENTIIAELQKGYKLGDRVLRPALVNVATKG